MKIVKILLAKFRNRINLHNRKILELLTRLGMEFPNYCEKTS